MPARTLNRLVPQLMELLRHELHEYGEMLTRLDQQARQNHLLLSRLVTLMQRFINSLISAGKPVTCNEGGQLQAGAPATQALERAVG